MAFSDGCSGTTRPVPGAEEDPDGGGAGGAQHDETPDAGQDAAPDDGGASVCAAAAAGSPTGVVALRIRELRRFDDGRTGALAVVEILVDGATRELGRLEATDPDGEVALTSHVERDGRVVFHVRDCSEALRIAARAELEDAPGAEAGGGALAGVGGAPDGVGAEDAEGARLDQPVEDPA